MDDSQIILAISDGLLARRGITWEPEQAFIDNNQAACNAALALLRRFSGNSEFLPIQEDDLDLAINCAWYLLDLRRAEFLVDYAGELTNLRLREAYGCGKDQDSDILK